jgi:hypothetical protein
MERVSLFDLGDLEPVKILNPLTFHILNKTQYDMPIRLGGHEFSSFLISSIQGKWPERDRNNSLKSLTSFVYIT